MVQAPEEELVPTRVRRGRRPVWSVIVVAVALLTASALWLTRDPEPVDVAAPTDAELDALAGSRVFFAHQSVGRNIISGIEAVYDDAGATAPLIAETETPVEGSGGSFAHINVGVNGDPLGKIAEFERVMDGPMGDSVQIAVLKLCYVDIVAGTDVDAMFEAYVSAMAGLEARHPDVTFLYTTVPLTAARSWKGQIKALLGRGDTSIEDNVAREQYNTLIRDKYGDSGRLFDIAAVESTLDQDPTEKSADGETYYVLNDALRSDNGHLNDLGARAAAAEFASVVAGVTAAP